MRESTVEHRLVTEVKKRGGIALKFVSPGIDGVPDRLVLLPDGKFAFVEVKAPGKQLEPLFPLCPRLYGCTVVDGICHYDSCAHVSSAAFRRGYAKDIFQELRYEVRALYR